jgi:hypothetical protein
MQLNWRWTEICEAEKFQEADQYRPETQLGF